MMTPSEFSAKVKAKYPEYGEMDDVDLTKRILDKYPEYREDVAFEAEPAQVPVPVDAKPSSPNRWIGLGLPKEGTPTERAMEFLHTPAVNFNALGKQALNAGAWLTGSGDAGVIRSNMPRTYGTMKGIGSFLTGLATPMNAGIGALIPYLNPLARRAVSAGFAGLMGKDTLENLNRYRLALQGQDLAQKFETGTEATLSGLMALGAGKHAFLPDSAQSITTRPMAPEETPIFDEMALRQGRMPVSPERQLPAPGQATGPINMGMRPDYLTPESAQNTLMALAGPRPPALPAPGQATGAIPMDVRPDFLTAEQAQNTLRLLAGDRRLGLPSPGEATGAIPLPAPEGYQPPTTPPRPSLVKSLADITREKQMAFDPEARRLIKMFTGKDILEYGQELEQRRLQEATKPQPIEPPTVDELDIMRHEIEKGMTVWGRNNFPEYFQGRGFSKQDVLGTIDKQIRGDPLTSRQQMMLDELLKGRRAIEQARSSDPTEFNFGANSGEQWPSEAGAVINPVEAASLLLKTARESKSYQEFREKVAHNQDLRDTARYMRANLQEIYNKRDEQPGTKTSEPPYIPPGVQPPNMDIKPPAGAKERGFITTVKESPRTDPKVAGKLSGTYEPITNADTIKKAQEIIAADPERAQRMVRTNQPATALSNTVAQLLIDRAQKEGRYEEAIDIVEYTAKKATAQGQSIQALSIYNRLSPEGVLRFTQRIIDKANADNPDLKLKLEPKQAQDIVDTAKRVQQMPDGEPKTVETAKLLKKIKEAIPPTPASKIAAYQTIAQLLNPKTFGRNLLGNLGFAGLENVSDVVATGLDVATSAITGKRTKVLPDLGTQYRGAKEGFKKGFRDAMEGVDTSAQASKYDLPKGNVFQNPFMKMAEKAMNVSLKATDRAFYEGAYQESLRQQMKAAKTAEPSLEMKEQAHYDALRRTFQDDNVISRAFVGIKRVLNANKEFGVGDFVIKYPKTPANILARGIEYSPAGFIKTSMELARPLFGKSFNQKSFVESTSRALVGTGGLVGTGFLLHQLGIITGKRDKDKDIAGFKREMGLGEYRINVSALRRFVAGGFDPDAAKLQPGDTLVSYDWFQPAAIGLSMGANISDQKLDPTSAMGTLVRAVGEGTDTLVEQPLVQGIKRLGGHGDIVQGAASVLKEIPASFVPTLLKQVRELVDPKARSSYDPDPIKASVNRAVNKVPGLSQTLPPSVNQFGQDREVYKGGTNNLFNVFLNPAFVSKYVETPEAKMVLEVYDRTGLTTQTPRIASTEQTISGMKRKLSPDEYTALQRFIGERTQKEFQRLSESNHFQYLPDDQKAKKMATLLTDIGLAAKQEVLGDQPRTGDGRVRLQKEIAKENLLTFLEERTPENKKAFIESLRRLTPEARKAVQTQARKEWRANLLREREEVAP